MADLRIVKIEKGAEIQVIIGHAGFIKTVEDLYEAMVSSAPGIKFGIGFVEASGACIVRSEGNDDKLRQEAESNAAKIGAGHTFVIFFTGAYPINVNNAVKGVSEVVSIYCSTANPVQVITTETDQGIGVLGIVDGAKPKATETAKDRETRMKLVRDMGYKVK